jgi:DhnA family fructose-bisphosphate aldolase class Ia
MGDAYDGIRDTRLRDPGAVAAAAERRRTRPLSGPSGRLLLVAADHPARGALGVGPHAHAMASRREMLDRLCAVLSRPAVDGVLATPDLVEDLLLLGALDDKVVIGSMNRGGLRGAVFELDDRFTAYDAATVAAMGLNGGKMLCRIDLHDPATARTLEACAQAVTGLASRRLMAMVEPFLCRREGTTVRHDLSPEAVIQAVHIAQGLGATSAYTWLKLPVVPEMERVMEATTLPTLLLGGDPTTSPDETYASWRRGLAAPGVRGLVVGRALLYPADGDVLGALDTAVELVHGSAP